MNKFKWVGAVLALGAVALVGCGGDSRDSDGDDGGSSGGEAVTITVVAKEFSFDPATLEVAADTEFTIELDNVGAIEHDITITGYEAQKIATTAGKSASGSFTLPAGTYAFYCSVAGHKEAGMTGTLNVG